MKPLFALVCAAVLAFPVRAADDLIGETLSPEAVKKVDDAVKAEMKRQGIVGAAVGLIKDKKVVYTKGYGWADRENEKPVFAGKTMFRWASVSKPVAAVVAMKLREDGKLKLDDDVRDHVPDGNWPLKVKPPITIKHLLCHQSGIPHYGGAKGTKRKYPGQKHPMGDPVNALDIFNKSELVSSPGERYLYSTYGYVLLSAAAQKAGGESFADQIRKVVSEPLGITTLQPDYDWVKISGRSAGYTKGGVLAESTEDVSWKTGGGGLISTVDDFARFAAGLMQGKLLKSETQDLMWTAQKTTLGTQTSAGLGFFIDGSGAGKKVHHDGSQEHVETRLVFYPGTGQGIVVMTNTRECDPSGISTAIWKSGAFE